MRLIQIQINIIFYILFALTASFFSCKQGEIGVFASIERTNQVKKSNLPKKITPKGVLLANNYYYTTFGALYARSTSAQDWEKVKTPSESESNVEALASFNKKLYASFSKRQSGSAKLYSVDIDTITSSTYNDPKWTLVTPKLPSTQWEEKEIFGLYVANEYLFIVTQLNVTQSKDPPPPIYSLWALASDGSTVSKVTTEDKTNLAKIINIVFINNMYWVLTHGTIYYIPQNKVSLQLKNAFGSNYQPNNGKNYIFITVIDSTLYVSTQDYIYQGTFTPNNPEPTWKSISTTKKIQSLFLYQNKYYAITYSDGIHLILSSNSDFTIDRKIISFPALSTTSWKTEFATVLGKTLFIATIKNGLWSVPLPITTTNKDWKNE